MKCPNENCEGDLKISIIGGGIFHCQCKKCGSEFEAKFAIYGEPPKIIGPWPYKKCDSHISQ